MGTYAENTSVSSEKSRAEIERTLTRWGASQFMYGWDSGDPASAIVGFVVRDRQIRFMLTMPDRNSPEFTMSAHKPPRPRTPAQREEAYEQAVRQRWRAMNLVIKAKLEAVESGISTFDSEFLAQLVLPNGQTVGAEIVPWVAEAYETNRMPALLPDYEPKAIGA